jgi:hypothetical protein
VAKCNRLLAIEADLGEEAAHRGTPPSRTLIRPLGGGKLECEPAQLANYPFAAGILTLNGRLWPFCELQRVAVATPCKAA